jgi:hypothetical protein
VEGISQACVPDPDDRLYHLLLAAIDECKAWMPAKPTVVAPVRRESVEIR